MLDPFKTNKTLPKVQEAVSYYEFYDDVYPEKIVQFHNEQAVNKNSIKPPKVIFLPELPLIHQMIKAVAKYGNSDSQEAFLLRFGLLDDPVWYLEQDKN